MNRAGHGVLLVLVMASGVGWAAPAGADQPGSPCSGITNTDTPSDDDTAASQSIEDLQIERVHELLRERGRSLGGGTRIAVVDSGIASSVRAHVERPEAVFKSGIAPDSTELFYQGTAIAGLIAGAGSGSHPIGVAPAVTLIDVPVYDTVSTDSTSGAKALDPATLVAALDRLADARGSVDVVNISLQVGDVAGLRSAIDRLTSQGVIVVAASGDRPESTDEPFGTEFGPEPEPGENAAGIVFPAGYADPDEDPLVVAVSSTVPEGDEESAGVVLPNSAISVTAPTLNGVSYGVNGTTCHLDRVSTRYAAAEVSGVLALLRSAFPDDSPQQLVARLEHTAAGSASEGPGSRGSTLGFGVIQPLEALTRIGAEAPEPATPHERVTPVKVAPPEPDRLRSTRRNAVWWGLGGGGALVIAVLLRPVLARRRPSR